MVRLIAVFALAGCTGTSEDSDASPPEAEVESFTFTNTGDAAQEGHTPRGFQGQGSGMFVGDDLNAGFPAGDGVQMFVSIDLEDFTDEVWEVQSAFLRSENVELRGMPLEDLGALTVEEMKFNDFSSDLWDKAPVTDGVSCTYATDADDAFGCDVTAAIQSAVDDGKKLARFRFRLDVAGDSDGEQDMILFYVSDSNETEPGLFDLDVEASPPT